jgi:hypothetical protein
MFMVGCSLRAVVMQFLTYFRLAGHLIFLPFASALHATVACFTEIFSISAGVSLTAFATQLLTNFRLAGHLIFFSLASALHAAVVSFRARLLHVGRSRGLHSGRRECSAAKKYSDGNAGT